MTHKELKTHNVQLITIHDPADRNSAAGRLMESMLVTIKTFENEQIGEKVRTKMRMRAEKGLWDGGAIPFGFRYEAETQKMLPDPEKQGLVVQLFQTYVESRSDFAVRDWLKAHQIPAPNGKPVWAPGTIRDLLSNRRYIAEIEINRQNEGLEDIPEGLSYRIVSAPHEPLVSTELFELAQMIRQEKAQDSPNRRGKGKNYSQNQCGRIYPLQGILKCATCGSSMSPYYVHHKPGKHRRTESFVHYYLCAEQARAWAKCDHRNIILAKKAEAWIMAKVEELVTAPDLIEEALQIAQEKAQRDLRPQQEALQRTRAAIQENQTQINRIIESISSGKADEALWGFLNARAKELKGEQERLNVELRRLTEELLPLSNSSMRNCFVNFSRAFKKPQEKLIPKNYSV